MKLISVTMSNFKSFKNPTTFEIPSEPGLYYVTGKNLVDPELQANGTGKSNLWDAITWCLFGKTVRELRASDISNWDTKKETIVSCVFTKQNKTIEVTRAWNPNSLVMSITDDKGKKIAKPVIEEDIHYMIGMTFTPFMNSTIIGQFGTFFLDLLPTTKTNLVAKVMDLDRWTDFSAKASLLAKETLADLKEVREKIIKTTASAEELQKIDFEDSIEIWNASNKRARQEARAELQEVQELIDADAAQHDQLQHVTVYPKVSEETIVLEKAAAKAANAVTSVKNKIQQTEQDIKDTLAKLSSIEVDCICLECDTKLTDKKAQVEKDKYEYRLEDLAELKDSLLKQLDDARKEAKVTQQWLDKSRSNDSTNYSSTYKAAERLRELKSSLRLLEAREDALINKINSLKNERNPWLQQKEECLAAIARYKATVKSLTKQEAKLEALFARRKYWIEGFKDIRLHLVSESLLQLEIESNGALSQLGLPDWKMEFDIDSETKSGTIKKGFAVLISSPNTPKQVAWNAWSGGESQRLRLASQLGLANLITSSLGVNNNFEVWDEPSNYMSEEGILDLLELLRERAFNTKKVIFVVDHHSLEFGGFSGKFTVVKDSKGSRIQ